MEFRASWVALPLLVICAAHSYAVDPASISAGPFEITPTLGFDTKFDDNIFFSPDDEEDDTIYLINPNIKAVAKDGENEYVIEFDLVDGTFQDSGDDDFTDWKIDGDIHWELNRRNMIDIFAGFHDLHEYRGTGFSQGEVALLIDDPDEYEEVVYGGHYTFGGADSKGRIKLGGDYYDKDYTNNEPVSDVRDRENTSFDGTFYWKIAPKTDLLAEVRYTEIEYQTEFTDGTPQLDSDEIRYLVGVQWEATGKTTGTLKVGMVDKDFDDNGRDDFDNEFTWDVDVLWQPREQHIVNLGVAQLINETIGQGDFINTEEYVAGWLFSFSDRLDFFANARYANDEYEGTPREDDLIYGELGVEYEFRRWLGVRASYAYDERDSQDSGSDLDYERNVFLIGLDFSL